MADPFDSFDNVESRVFKCEVCAIRVLTTDKEAFNRGWDYPRLFGYPDTTIAPHTCPDCGIDQTAWWVLAVVKTPDALTDKQKSFVQQVATGTWGQVPVPSESADENTL